MKILRQFALLLFFITNIFFSNTFSQGFKVCDAKIYDPSGNEFIVKGTNVGGPGWNWPENTLAYYDHIVKWKFNTVRLVVKGAPSLDSYTSFQCAKTNFPQYKYATSGTMREIIKKYTDGKIVVLIDWQEVGGIYTDLNCAKSWFQMLANEYKNNPYVWFDMYNEPKTDKTSWTNAFQTIINTIRATGNNNIIVASGNYWGQDANNWECKNISDANSAILTSTLSDPAGNLVYSIHTYDQWTQCQSKLDNYLDRVIAQKKCIIMGEYGVYNNSDVTPAVTHTLNSTQVRGVGRIQWAFWGGDNNDLIAGGNGGGQNSVYNATGNCTNLTAFGQKVWADNRRVEPFNAKLAECNGKTALHDAKGQDNGLSVQYSSAMNTVRVKYEASGNSVLKIFSLSGIEMLSMNLAGEIDETLNLRNLGKGVYVIYIQTGNKRLYEKVIAY